MIELVQQHLWFESCRTKILRHTCNILQDVFTMRTEKCVVSFLSSNLLTSVSCRQTSLKQHLLFCFPLWERKLESLTWYWSFQVSFWFCATWLESFGKNTWLQNRFIVIQLLGETFSVAVHNTQHWNLWSFVFQFTFTVVEVIIYFKCFWNHFLQPSGMLYFPNCKCIHLLPYF